MKTMRDTLPTSQLFPIAASYAHAVLLEGDCLNLLAQMPDNSVGLVATSPPYNLGKSYERKDDLENYLAWQDAVIAESIRVLHPKGSICCQVGNHVNDGSIDWPKMVAFNSSTERPNRRRRT